MSLALDKAPASISLVMCTIGATPWLLRLAHSLAAQDRRDFELIVVDQSPPGALDEFTAAIPDWLEWRVVRSPRGLSRARNAGLKEATAPIVAIPDDDAWYPPNLVSQILTLFASRPGYDVLTGVTRDEYGQLSNGTFLSQDAEVTVKNVWIAGNSNAIFFRRDPARDIDGFDETLGVGSGTPFGSGEETDFLLRLLRSGRKAAFVRNLVVHHDQVDNRGGSDELRRAHLYSAGYGRVLRMNQFPLTMALYRSLRGFVAAILFAARGRGWEARRRLIWSRGILRGFFARVQ